MLMDYQFFHGASKKNILIVQTKELKELIVQTKDLAEQPLQCATSRKSAVILPPKAKGAGRWLRLRGELLLLVLL
jgi:hypothetical protein